MSVRLNPQTPTVPGNRLALPAGEKRLELTSAERKPAADGYDPRPAQAGAAQVPDLGTDLNQILEGAPKASTLPKLRKALQDPDVRAVDPAAIPVPKEILESIEKAKRVLIVAHSTPFPDGDAVGSTLGLSRALEAMGKEVDVCLDEKLTSAFRKLDQDKEISRADALADRTYDLAIVADVSEAERIGGAHKLLANAAEVSVIDHHEPSGKDLQLPGNVPYRKWTVPECDAAALQALAVVANLEERGASFTKEQWASIAKPLLLGSLTDSGFFSYDSVEALSVQLFKHALQTKLGGDFESLEKALDAVIPASVQVVLGLDPSVELPADVPAELAEKIKSLGRLQVQKVGGDRIGILAVPQAFIDVAVEAGKVSDSEYNEIDAKNFLKSNMRGLRDLPVSVLLNEEKGLGVTCSIRSSEKGAALALARALGGGGHENAAGASVKGATLQEVVQKIEQWAAENKPAI